MKDGIAKITKTNMQHVESVVKSTVIKNRSNRCPCCGKKCLGVLLLRETYGFFRVKSEHFYAYSCARCGTQWESDTWEG